MYIHYIIIDEEGQEKNLQYRTATLEAWERMPTSDNMAFNKLMLRKI